MTARASAARIDGLWESWCGPVRSSLFFLQLKHQGLFFNPFQLHLELADLTVKFRRHLFAFSVLFPATIGKYMGNFFQKPLAPLANLVGMNPILARKVGPSSFRLSRLPGLPWP